MSSKTPSKTKPTSSRRQFLNRAAVIAAGLPLPALLGWNSPARAEDLPHLGEDDPTAKALKYTHDATTATGRSSATDVCDNCMHYSGEAGSEWGPCALFPGKQVNAKGWCSAWIIKPG